MRKHFLPTTESEQVQPDPSRFVFLGGTCNGSTWRETLIPMLSVAFFNPVVAEWTEADRLKEELAKKRCIFELYVITPKQKGVYTPVEMAISAMTNNRTLVVILPEDEGQVWDEAQRKSLDATVALVKEHGNLNQFNCLEDLAAFLNKAVTLMAPRSQA